MPNSRRRKFSVQNGRNNTNNSNRVKTIVQNCQHVQESTPIVNHEDTTINNLNQEQTKHKVSNNCSISNNLSIKPTSFESQISCKTETKLFEDKNVIATSSNINTSAKDSITKFKELCKNKNVPLITSTSRELISVKKLTNKTDDSKTHSKENCTHLKNINSKRQRCTTTVRSPRRSVVVANISINKTDKPNINTAVLNKIFVPNMTTSMTSTDDLCYNAKEELANSRINPSTTDKQTNTREDGSKASMHSIDEMCRICHGGESASGDLGPMVSACSCRGTVGRVHVKCLERWLTESGKSICELCGTKYVTKRVHKYGVPRALVMWILSHNAKQLLVDSLGIILMSPLAMVAAWLSGRTLAGLMTPESHTTSWPLASTFVLACMTLVCYYCWVVSAATRHALGWWIWYRSQYEVRLQILQLED